MFDHAGYVVCHSPSSYDLVVVEVVADKVVDMRVSVHNEKLDV